MTINAGRGWSNTVGSRLVAVPHVHLQAEKCPGRVRDYLAGAWTQTHPRSRSMTHSTRTHTTHPGWCSRQFCRESDVDTQHSSAPVVLRTTNALISLACVSTDSDSPELRVEVVDVTTVGDDCRTHLPARDVRRLWDALGIEIGRLRFQSAPVAHGTPVTGDAA